MEHGFKLQLLSNSEFAASLIWRKSILFTYMGFRAFIKHVLMIPLMTVVIVVI